MKNDLPAGTEVFADPCIARVVSNLMDNAIRNGGKITTILFSLQESGDEHLIVCEDDGDGVPADEKERIFERDFGKKTVLGLFLSGRSSGSPALPSAKQECRAKGAQFEMLVPKGTSRKAGSGRD